MEDLLEAVEGQVVAVFGDHQISEQSGGSDRSGDDAIFGGQGCGDHGCLHRQLAGLLRGGWNRPHRAADDEPLEVPGTKLILIDSSQRMKRRSPPVCGQVRSLSGRSNSRTCSGRSSGKNIRFLCFFALVSLMEASGQVSSSLLPRWGGASRAVPIFSMS